MPHRRWLPSRERILASRWLRPVAHRLNDERLWHLDRRSAARGTAIGLFFGLLLPFAQFLFAILGAVLLRGHLAVAAAATLVTNPLTFPPIYWLAHRIGRWLLGQPPADEAALREQRQAERIADAESWIEALWAWLLGAGWPILTGLAVLATVSAAAGYLLVWLLWRDRRRD